jgi:hypothetical protein
MCPASRATKLSPELYDQCGVTTSNAASRCGTRLALHSWMSWGCVPRVPWNMSQKTYSSIKFTSQRE